ncbi:hypothetical protein JHD49_06145 [Sulfurimonas sp. SAG-AH-194-C21]|nr:hypothetical protein [Sulfurimonas sp. SAG-AH-194-C21]MDF1883517.1 hypothetical protein [Sulfurimonas sp. SAG-AH-194-C21]
MYTVTMEKECACFIKSEYQKETSFQFQNQAYQYTTEVMELMNEEFCQTHMFYAEKSNDNEYIIRVAANNGSADSCSTDSCGSCGC